jgi:hypothetical protein
VAKKYYGLLIVLILAYLAITFATDPDAARVAQYNINATQLRFILLTVSIPASLIWLAAFYGLVNVSKYAEKIKGSPDGKGFQLIARGLIFLGIGLPLNSVISSLLNYGVSVGEISQNTATIITTHMAIVFPLVGFIFLLAGSHRLLSIIKKAKKIAAVPFEHAMGLGFVLAFVSALYVLATFTNPAREIAVAPATKPTYGIPDWLTLITIVLPYIFIWGCGLYTALQLRAYQQTVGGKVYKKSLAKLNMGLVAVILTSILLQFLTAASSRFLGWHLGSILGLIYVLLAIIAIGYILIALGAKGLAKLEEVT